MNEDMKARFQAILDKTAASRIRGLRTQDDVRLHKDPRIEAEADLPKLLGIIEQYVSMCEGFPISPNIVVRCSVPSYLVDNAPWEYFVHYTERIKELLPEGFSIDSEDCTLPSDWPYRIAWG